MSCENQIGVRNLFITLRDCDSDQTYGPFSHDVVGDELPQLNLCEFTNEALPGGRSRKIRGTNEISFTVYRNLGIPLAMYQGCASIDVTIEYYSGYVVTGLGGIATGDESSDGHEVTVTASFREIDEFMPAPAESTSENA